MCISAPSQIPPNIQKTTIARDSSFPTCTISSEAQPLGPLVIDVPSNNASASNNDASANNQTRSTEGNVDPKAEMLVKTVDFKNASAPKVDIEDENKNTPQVQPQLKKSSSTPRRTSHVRVLDFTTPRRILQETINEHGLDENGQPLEVIVSKSPSLQSFVESASKGDDLTNINNKGEKKVTCNDSNTSGSSKENEGAGKVILKKVVPVKTYNWDAELRALVGTKDEAPKQKQKSVKSKKLTTDKPDGEKVEKNVSEKKKSNKNHICNPKSKDKKTQEPTVKVEDATVPIKPNINIITSNDWNNLHDNDKNQNKSQNEKQTDTPEMERISLQNALGVKLNISDLLETPYKQAIYDIQMETPRFLGPDLPDVPLSDIKIMNIPTPRFLNTPKPSQLTPSSYSSRPTDYSSGGSYYKPDDQDYIPVDLEYPPISSLKSVSQVKTVQSVSEKQKEVKQKSNGVKSRPVRKCTKNVSYYNSPMVNKTKDDEKSEVVSSCSDSINTNSPNDNKVTHFRSNTRTKSEKKRKSTTARKRKTPVKKDTPKSFMKIKPRKPTTTRESLSGRHKRKTPDSSKKRIGKDKVIGATPIVATVPTKSRRKSSTPRKLHCTKTFNSESSGHNSPEIACASKEPRTRESSVSVIQDSDTEQLRLRWSDDGSQDAKPIDQLVNNSTNESEDISKIKEYIEITEPVYSRSEHNLHIDLVKRGFDIETARIIERDLLDTPPVPSPVAAVVAQKHQSQENTNASVRDVAQSITPTPKLQPADESEETEIEFSVSECNEESTNYFTCVHVDADALPKKEFPKLKDKFSMEVCIDDDVKVRLRAAPFTVLLDQEPAEAERLEDMYKETEIAVNSISNIDRLYTPLKDSVKAQCYEIFDSTLTSLDTPLKVTSPNRKQCEAEIILEVEKVEVKEKLEIKKRKRLHSSEISEESANENKKSKPDTQYLLTTTNIQNIDIETVLSKLHGP